MGCGASLPASATLPDSREYNAIADETVGATPGAEGMHAVSAPEHGSQEDRALPPLGALHAPAAALGGDNSNACSAHASMAESEGAQILPTRPSPCLPPPAASLPPKPDGKAHGSLTGALQLQVNNLSRASQASYTSSSSTGNTPLPVRSESPALHAGPARNQRSGPHLSPLKPVSGPETAAVVTAAAAAAVLETELGAAGAAASLDAAALMPGKPSTSSGNDAPVSVSPLTPIADAASAAVVTAAAAAAVLGENLDAVATTAPGALQTRPGTTGHIGSGGSESSCLPGTLGAAPGRSRLFATCHPSAADSTGGDVAALTHASSAPGPSDEALHRPCSTASTTSTTTSLNGTGRSALNATGRSEAETDVLDDSLHASVQQVMLHSLPGGQAMPTGRYGSSSTADEAEGVTPKQSFDLAQWRTFYNKHKQDHAKLLEYLWQRFDPKSHSILAATYKGQDQVLAGFQGDNVCHGYCCRLEQSGLELFGLLHTLASTDLLHFKVLGVLVVAGPDVPPQLSSSADDEHFQLLKADTTDPLVRQFVGQLLVSCSPIPDFKVTNSRLL